ncbi:MAG: HDIG domain-containing protein [Bacteroidetes bacterium]|jgi:cyclic-di-AMP phosphodiesterase PgpH|nr:HDIG domain-containing protein [Bacteroidota bacterium]MBT3750585.1 HDIG domain-containing protein [Bacteroidota bacterium]MBT4401415.1 HDIG domain-containing protein [Bacteroidota bacterium]MBT7093661.1 HDIG domain-containing protein [Bacteroidota bacterium]MBT7464236.1 HDIG domain-containing protein [Bacteroidota bacterium]
MKAILRKIAVYFSRIITGLLFIAAVVSVYYLFPRQGTFPFEFQKGSPWMHETLIAEFDFPVLKSGDNLIQERDSILAQLKPYFELDESVSAEQIYLLRDGFHLVWDRYVATYSLDTLLSGPVLHNLEARYLLRVSACLDSIYQTGILPELGESELLTDVDNGLMVVRNKIVSDRLPNEVTGTLENYQRLKQMLQDTLLLPGVDRELVDRLFGEIGFNRYILSNLNYDHETTLAVQRTLLDEISTTRGLVQEGQRVIGRGEMVSDEAFMYLESFRSAYEAQTGDITTIWLIRIGQVLLIVTCFLALFFFLRQYRPEIVRNNLKLTFVLLLIVLSVLAGSFGGRSETISIYLVPFIIAPVVMRAFFDSRLSLFILLITMMIVGFLVPNGFNFIFIQIMAGFAAIVSFSHLHRRSQLVFTAIIVFLVSAILYLGLALMHEGSFLSIEWINIAWLAANAVLVLFSYPLIYIFEKLFGFISDVTLIELSDSNHPILRKLAEDAPGTFQHSMQVANLAETVIRSIGGNPLLVRAGAMYHDIGKIESAMYFTENQVDHMNPHDNMDHKESATLIIKHVIRGAEIAKKNKIPKPVADFILTHHGTTKPQYFYKMYKRKHPEEIIEDKEFLYPGPTPNSKEAAVMMMADSIEAASRSLKDYSEASLGQLINDIIESQLAENQFNEAEITFRDITRAKEIFLKKLTNIYHARIQYPK